MKKFEAIKTVYSYLFPEVREIISDLTKEFPHEVYLRSTETSSLDDFHEPVIENVMRFHSASVPHLKDFAFRYPTSGSEEGIREFQTYLQANGVKEIYVLKGEYEGFKEVGATRCIKTIEVEPGTDPKKLKPGIWFVSNPSAIDGNVIPNKFIDGVCDAGHRVFYDLAYLGSTHPHTFNLNHENIIGAVVSFSKTFGLFYHRVGFTFSREPIPSLYSNKWFKNILSLMIADKIVTKLDPNYIYDKYRPVQEKIVEGINKDFSLGMRPSDALLLGYLTGEDAAKLSKPQLDMIKKFQRGNGYRFCLREYYLKAEKNS